MESAWYLVQAAVFPSDKSQISIFYFIWITFYLLLNISWDVKSPRTPEFHLSHLKDKVPTVYDASTAASSALILIALLSPKVQQTVVDTVVPLVLAGLSGLLYSVGRLCPYQPDNQAEK